MLNPRTDIWLAPVGATLFSRGVLDRNPAFPTTPNPDHCVHEPPLWRYALLRHQSVRSLCTWDTVLSTGAVLFLGVLLYDEFRLDCGSILYDFQTL